MPYWYRSTCFTGPKNAHVSGICFRRGTFACFSEYRTLKEVLLYLKQPLFVSRSTSVVCQSLPEYRTLKEVLLYHKPVYMLYWYKSTDTDAAIYVYIYIYISQTTVFGQPHYHIGVFCVVGNEERLLGAFFSYLLYWYQRTGFSGTNVLYLISASSAWLETRSSC